MQNIVPETKGLLFPNIRYAVSSQKVGVLGVFGALRAPKTPNLPHLSEIIRYTVGTA
jgi:hypothetical protein